MIPRNLTSFTDYFLATQLYFLEIVSSLFANVKNTALALFGLIFKQLFSTQSLWREVMLPGVVIILLGFVSVRNIDVSSV